MDGFDILPCVKPLSAVMLAVKAVTGMQFAAGQITMTRDMLALDLMRDDFADAPLDPEMLSRLRSRIERNSLSSRQFGHSSPFATASAANTT